MTNCGTFQTRRRLRGGRLRKRRVEPMTSSYMMMRLSFSPPTRMKMATHEHIRSHDHIRRFTNLPQHVVCGPKKSRTNSTRISRICEILARRHPEPSHNGQEAVLSLLKETRQESTWSF